MGAELSLLGKTLNILVPDYFLGAQDGPTHHRLPWDASMDLLAVGKQYFGGHKAGTKGHTLCDSMYTKCAE